MILRGLKEILGPVIAQPFQLSDISTFPDSEFSVNRARYLEYWNWWNGVPLEEKQTQGTTTVDKYPIRVNPLKSLAIKHAYALFGEVQDDSRPLVTPHLKPNTRDPQEKEDAHFAENILNLIWWENNGRTVMIRNGIISQIMGGCVFKAAYIPTTPNFPPDPFRSIPITVEAVPPTNFIGFPAAGDDFRLKEAWMATAISYQDALRYRVQIPQDQEAYYVEHWTETIIEYRINGYAIPTGTYDNYGNPVYFGGPNPFGLVPIVYIPHIRTQGFYGESHITEALKGIIFELNARLADLGDASADDSHRYYFMRNTNGIPEVLELAPGLRVVNGGTNPNVTGKEGAPDITEIGGQRLTEPMQKFIGDLTNWFRREASVPAVSDGEDEGSQRSSSTLAMRMWPLLSHTRTERYYWTDGLSRFERILLIMVSIKHLVKNFPDSALKMRIEQKWAPMLPRDREQLVNELVNRAASHVGSLEHLMELTEDIEDPNGELQKVIAEIKEIADVQAKAVAENQPPQNPRTPQKSGDSNPRTKAKGD